MIILKMITNWTFSILPVELDHAELRMDGSSDNFSNVSHRGAGMQNEMKATCEVEKSHDI